MRREEKRLSRIQGGRDVFLERAQPVFLDACLFLKVALCIGSFIYRVHGWREIGEEARRGRAPSRVGSTCQMLALPLAPVWLPPCGRAQALCESRRSDELAGCYGEELVTWPGCCSRLFDVTDQKGGERRRRRREADRIGSKGKAAAQPVPSLSSPRHPGFGLLAFGSAPMPGPTQALSPNGENNNDIIQDNGTIIPFRKHTVRGERSYR